MARDLTIVVAEDNEDYAFFLERILQAIQPANRTVMLADGAEVADYLCGNGQYRDRELYPLPDLLLTDLKMPRMSGFDLLRWLQAHPECSTTPTLVLSSSSDEHDVVLAYELGAAAFLIKPGGLDEIETMLRGVFAFWTSHAPARV